MSASEPGIINPVLDWIESCESEQIDELAAAYDPDADISLRGESIRLSLASLKRDCDIGDKIFDILVSSGRGTAVGSTRLAVREAVTERLPDDQAVEKPDEDEWSIEWVDPLDSMEIDISSALSRHTDRLVAVKGRVRQKTDPIPWFRSRKYRCTYCLTEQRDAIPHRPRDEVERRVKEPRECINETCPSTNFEVIPEESDKRDYQHLTIEQSPGADGSTPSKIPCWVFGEGRLMDVPEGERVTVVGRLRLNTNSEPAEHYLEASTVIADREDDSVEVTDEDRERVREFVANLEEPLETAAENLAPQVHGHSLAKQGLVLAAVGSGFDAPDEQTHVLLIGDPGTAKTELTGAIRELVPSTRQASLTQSSSVGLTASAVKESVAGGEEWVIRAGALSLASGGILTIDELDEADFDLSKLNDALSEGEIPVDKAGESTRIKTDTRVIATANPENAEFDPYEPLDEQIQFTADVVSRFDLAFPFVDDSGNDAMNEGIMKATGADYLPEEELTGEYDAYTRDVDLELLRKWIAIAREQQPTLTSDAMDTIRDLWMLLREASDGGSISINARRLRTVVRLARAHARLRLGDEVVSADAEAAFKLVSNMLSEWNFDIEDGDVGSDDRAEGSTERDDGSTSHKGGLSGEQHIEAKNLARGTDYSVEEITEIVDAPEEAVRDLVERVRERDSSPDGETGEMGLGELLAQGAGEIEGD